jgi:hypothetical protein
MPTKLICDHEETIVLLTVLETTKRIDELCICLKYELIQVPVIHAPRFLLAVNKKYHFVMAWLEIMITHILRRYIKANQH